jgi:hypothetical protein
MRRCELQTIRDGVFFWKLEIFVHNTGKLCEEVLGQFQIKMQSSVSVVEL